MGAMPLEWREHLLWVKRPDSFPETLPNLLSSVSLSFEAADGIIVG
jgi:hypothetical protein